MAAQAPDYLPEMSQSSSSVPRSTIPGSDLDASSRPESSLSSAVPSSEQAHSSRKRSARLAPTSFSLLGLGRIPREFSSLIRSHSISTRGQKASTEPNLPQAGYADRPSFAVERQLASVEMSGTQTDDERASRKTKSSNRFYNFLTRPRSRSKSKAEDSTSTNKTAIPPLPSKGPLSQQNLNQSVRSSSPGAKPQTRVQSRPLSSTTTATNTTITPTNFRGKKPALSAIPTRAPGSKSKRKEDIPISPTKAAPRQKKHTLFGIPLPSSRKSSLGSRPATPAPVQTGDDPPPLPVLTHPIVTNDPITVSSPVGDDAEPESRPSTPSATRSSIKPKHSSSSTTTASATTASTAPTSASSRLESILRSPKFFSARSSSKGSRTPTLVPPVSPPLIVSPPSKIPHPIAKRNPRPSTSSQATPTEPMRQVSSPVPSPASPTVPSSDTSVNTPVSTPPKIVQTPAAPVQSVLPPIEKQPLDSSVHSRTQILRMTTIDEGKRSTSSIGYASASSIGRGSARDSRTSRFGSRIAMPIGVSRGNKHGSFDFERPGHSGSMARTGSAGTATSTSLTRDGGIETPSTSVPRDSIVGPGLAGVGTLQREMSIKRATEEEKAKKRVFEKKHRKAVSLQPPLPPLPQAAPLADPVNGSTSTAHTEATANTKASSWSKATGKKAIFSTSARLGLSHGPFAFEPAVPSPTGSTTTRGENDLSRTNSIQDKPRVSEALREKDRKSHKGDRPAIPVPSSSTNPPPPSASSVGYRSGLKGRSLDLNIGLAWAPTKVREDALLPSTFFSRTFSGSSSLAGRSNASGSLSSLNPGLGHDRSRSGSTSGKRGPEIGELGEKTLPSVGQEVAEMFRNALDTDGFAAFKQCVYRFDAHEIPFHGATGIVAQVERLLDKRATNIDEQSKRQLLDDFIRIILRNA